MPFLIQKGDSGMSTGAETDQVTEGELRQQHTTTSEGRVGKERDFPCSTKMLEGMKKYIDIPVPALVIFLIPHAQGKWVDDSTDPKVREAAKANSAAELVLTTRQAKAFEDGVPTAHVVGCVVRITTSTYQTRLTCCAK
jgi:hypothetical protein